MARAWGASRLGLLLSLAGSAGCELDPPLVHQRFAELQPASVAVLPVENRTIVDLSRVNITGPLQRLTLGAREVDVPAALREGLYQALQRRGYRTVEGAAADAVLPVEAVLRSEVTAWRSASPSGTGQMELEGRVELVSLRGPPGSREVIFERSFRHQSRPRGYGHATPFELVEDVRRAGLTALEGLPPVPTGAPRS